MIEKVNLRNCTNNSKFEQLEISLPEGMSTTLSEIGIYVPDNYMCIIFGGYSQQDSSSKQGIFKFSACQDSPETMTLMEDSEKLKQSDFFLV